MELPAAAGLKRLLFIYNPRSGRGLFQQHLGEIIEQFTEGGYLVMSYPTRSGYDFLPLLPMYGSVDAVCYAGGDGIMNAALNFHVKHEISLPITYMPAGTTNDFAHSVGIGTNIQESVRSVLSGGIHELDYGVLNGQAFTYVAAFGSLAEISYTTPQDVKNTLGYAAYLIEGMKRFPELKARHLKVTHDGGNFEGDFILGLVTNSNTVGGFRPMVLGDVSLTDGLLEVTLVRMPKNVTDMGAIMNALVTGETDEQNVISLKTGKLQILSDVELSWTIDGEFGGKYEDTEISCVRQGMKIRV